MKNPQDLQQERYNERWIQHFRNLQLHLTQISNLKTSPTHAALVTTKRPLRQMRDPGRDSYPLTQSGAISYRTPTFIEGNKRSAEEITQDGATNLTCRKTKCNANGRCKQLKKYCQMQVRALWEENDDGKTWGAPGGGEITMERATKDAKCSQAFWFWSSQVPMSRIYV